MADDPIDQTSGPPLKVTVTDVADHEIDPAAAATLGTMGVIASGIIEKYFGIKAASAIDTAAAVTAIMTGNWDKMMALTGKFYHAAQGEQNSGFYDLCASVLSDLTGVEVDAAKLKTSTFGSGRLAGMQEFGGDLFKQLEEEFKPQNGEALKPDAAPAMRFLGFLMNFAIRQGNVAAMCEAVPEDYKFLTGFREYGELMAKNLGLGRLARRALTPLVQTLVADPLQQDLNVRYRPTGLSTGQLLKAFFRKAIEEKELDEALSHQGYSKEKITLLKSDARPQFSAQNNIELYFRGEAKLETIQAGLRLLGYEDYQIAFMIELQRPQLDKLEIIHLYEGGEIELPEALELLAKLGYDDKTAHRVITAYELAHQPSVKLPKFHTKHLSLGELRKAYIDTNIDLFEFQDYLTRLGYSADDVQILTLDLLVDAKHHAELEQAKKEREAAKAAKATKAAPQN